MIYIGCIRSGIRRELYLHNNQSWCIRLYECDSRASARGGYGSIYHARKRGGEGEDVVLKTINLHACAVKKFSTITITPEHLEDVRKYISREWEALTRVKHPHIVGAKDDRIYYVKEPCCCGGDHNHGSAADGGGSGSVPTGAMDDVFVLVMEKLEQDIFELMHHYQSYQHMPCRVNITSFNQLPRSRLPPLLCRRVFYQIAKALDYLHQIPILHRDLSWGNVMVKSEVDGSLVAKLVDLGLARDLPRTQCGLSIEGIGTIAFSAPEYKTCGYGTRVDVWSLGILLYLMLTGNCDRNERSLRFRSIIDSIEYDHEACCGDDGRTCTFCEELLNDLYGTEIGAQELKIKKEALSLLEGMLRLTPEERMTTKQVLSHPWLAEERSQDPDPVDTEEEAELLLIPRLDGRPPLQLLAKKAEYPYLREPESTVLASTYRTSARAVRLGDVTTLGGVLSRLGVSSGERFLQRVRPFSDSEYLVRLDDCVPSRARGVYFRHFYLCLLDQPNDRRSLYMIYQALRTMDLSDSKRVIMPLLGFDVKFEDGSPYKGRLQDSSRKISWLDFALFVARTTDVEVMWILSWKRSTFDTVKATFRGEWSKLFVPMLQPPTECEAHVRALGEMFPTCIEGIVAIVGEEYKGAMKVLDESIQNFRLSDDGTEEVDGRVCRASAAVAALLIAKKDRLILCDSNILALLTSESIGNKLDMVGGGGSRSDVLLSIHGLLGAIQHVSEAVGRSEGS